MHFWLHYIGCILLFGLVGCENKKPLPVSQHIPITKTNEGVILEVDSVWLAQENDSLLYEFYRKNQWKTYWTAFNCRSFFLDKLENISEEGIDEPWFSISEIQQTEAEFNQLTPQQLLQYDVELTKVLKTYIYQVKFGNTDWNSLGRNWDIAVPKPNIAPVFLSFVPQDSFEKHWLAIAPQHPVYSSLKEALAYLKKMPENELTPMNPNQKFTVLDTSEQVVILKKNLQYWNYLAPNDSVTNVYDSIAFQAVKKFQQHHGLGNDGVVGRRTLGALNTTKAQRLQQIKINMERWRLFDALLHEEDVVVNIPDFRLYVLKNRVIQNEYRVIVGKPSRKTPVLSSQITHVVWNPTWTVPPTILKEDVVPAASRNRGYFASKNIQIYDSQGNRISASEWSPSKFRSYRYVQSPGNSNSLGLVKIMFPNQHSVYLHDTNSRNSFGLDQRSLSSGCVRVQNPIELTNYLLQDVTDWDGNKTEEILASGKTTQVNVKRTIYVHLWYWTAWMEDGKPQFRDDIYGWDAMPLKAKKQPEAIL